MVNQACITHFFVKTLKLVLIGGLVSACTTMPQGVEKITLIDQWAIANDFRRIDAALDNIDTSEPLYRELVKRRHAVRALKIQYETNVLREAMILQNSQQWPEAEKLLTGALYQLPASEQLTVRLNNFYVAREKRLQELQQHIALLKGEHLVAKQTVIDRSLNIHPDGWKTRWDSFWQGRRAKAQAQDLMQCGQSALQSEDYLLAESCLQMAVALDNSLDITEPMLQLAAALESEQQKAALVQVTNTNRKMNHKAKNLALKKEQQQQLQKELRQLDERYEKLLAASWLAQARDTLMEMLVLAPADTELLARRDHLLSEINDQVDQQLAIGEKYYANGELIEAQRIWQEIAPLAPNNDKLNANLIRVDKFLAKLSRLQQTKQQVH